MGFDLVLRNARIAGRAEAFDIEIAGGRIAAMEPNLTGEAAKQQLDGRLVLAGLVETHIHLDKSVILERCRCEQGTLKEAIAEVAAAKVRVHQGGHYACGRRALEQLARPGASGVLFAGRKSEIG